jgi:mevalonate pyrophosphate decarboxylase
MTNEQAFFEMHGVRSASNGPNINMFDQMDQVDAETRQNKKTHAKACFQSKDSGMRFSVMTRKGDWNDVAHIENTLNCIFKWWI